MLQLQVSPIQILLVLFLKRDQVHTSNVVLNSRQCVELTKRF